MKWKAILVTWLAIITGLVVLGANTSSSMNEISSHPLQLSSDGILYPNQQDPTPNPEVPQEDLYSNLPVAHNPGVVLGAMILVLIIISGVIINSNLLRKK